MRRPGVVVMRQRCVRARVAGAAGLALRWCRLPALRVTALAVHDPGACLRLTPLAPAPPRRLDGFARILEIVGGSDPEKQESRRRFRYYRDAGLTPAVHTLS